MVDWGDYVYPKVLKIIICGGVRQFGAEYITGGNPVW